MEICSQGWTKTYAAKVSCDDLLPLVEVCCFLLDPVLSQAYSSDCGKWWTKKKWSPYEGGCPKAATNGEMSIGKSGDCQKKQMSFGLLRLQGEIA